jgi:phosphoribosyl-AMP cyclohydrolase
MCINIYINTVNTDLWRFLYYATETFINMVLPLLPVINSLNDVEKASGQLTKNGFNAIGQIMFHGDTSIDSQIESIAKTSMNLDVIVDIQGLSVDQLIQLLDAGAAKIVVSKTQLLELNGIPAERMLVRLSEDQVATASGIEDIANSVAGIIIDSSFTLSVDPESLKTIVTSLQKTYLPTGGKRTVYLQYSSMTPPPTIAELKSLALLSIEPIIPSSYLTSSPKDHPSLLSVAQIALLASKTDRPDGLYATVVVDERDHALGLVYSSPESISESIRTGTGVYQSRERGLWYKGATSGATQELLGMSWDCDADCLRYSVKQAGNGILSIDALLTQDSVISREKAVLVN